MVNNGPHGPRHSKTVKKKWLKLDRKGPQWSIRLLQSKNVKNIFKKNEKKV